MKDAHKILGGIAEYCAEQYREIDFSKKYPANRKRLEIVLYLLAQLKPERILDVGCGTGDPLVRILKEGYNIEGYDYSDKMIEVAQENLRSNKFDPVLVSKNNMESPKGYEDNRFDCVLGLGAFYYARDFGKAMCEASYLLCDGGDLIFSLRNDLFSMFTLNKYTADFHLRHLVSKEDIPDILKDEYMHMSYGGHDSYSPMRQRKNIDDLGVHSVSHNPLTIQNEVLSPIGCDLLNIYYYHFHAFPPKYEYLNPERFRELSWEMENPTDWRGVFMASTFVVHARKGYY